MKNSLNLGYNEYAVVKDSDGKYTIVFNELPSAKVASGAITSLKAKHPEFENVIFSFSTPNLIDMTNMEVIAKDTISSLEPNEFYIVKGKDGVYYIVGDEEHLNSHRTEIRGYIEQLHPEVFLTDIRTVKPTDIDINQTEIIEHGYTKGWPYQAEPLSAPILEPTPINSTDISQEQEETFKPVDIKEYVTEGLDNGILHPIYAKKTAPTHLVQGEEGKEVISWIENPDGSPKIEREGIVQRDEETGELGWVATKVDSEGNPVIDRNGNMNQWIIRDSVFRKTYEPSKLGDNLYIKKEIQTLVQIPDNIVFKNKYGEVMEVAAGGYINITNYERMYGISERDFNDTHEIVQLENVETLDNTNSRTR